MRERVCVSLRACVCVHVRADGISWQCVLLFHRLWLPLFLLKNTHYIWVKEEGTVAELKGGAHSANSLIFSLFFLFFTSFLFRLSLTVCPSMVEFGHCTMSSCRMSRVIQSRVRDSCASPIIIFHNVTCVAYSINCIHSDLYHARFVVHIVACYLIKPTDKLLAQLELSSKPPKPNL